jgi:hypothetical protein
MMRDDDDLELSLSMSDPARIESSAKAKRKALEQKLKEKNLSKVVPPGADKSKLKLSVLRQQMEGKKDDETKRDREEKNKSKTSLGTKTREQEIAAAKLDAGAKPTADKMVEQSEREEKTKEDMQRQGETQANLP